jgi:hypothetical protein
MSAFEPRDVQRAKAVAEIVASLKDTYPDAKKLQVDISFEFVETEFSADADNFCPVVKINIER